MKQVLCAVLMAMSSTVSVANGLIQTTSCKARQVEPTQPLAGMAEQCASEFISAAAYSLQCGLDHAAEADYVHSPYFHSATHHESMEPLATLLIELGFEHFQITWRASEKPWFDYVLTIKTFTAGGESGGYETLSMYTESAQIAGVAAMEYLREGAVLVESVREIDTFGTIYLAYPQWQHCSDGFES